MRGVSQRVLSVAIIICVPVLAFAQQYQKLRDRDPDLAAAKQMYAELQQANFHYGPWYLMSRIHISDAGFSESGYLPTGDQGDSISLSVEAPQRLYFVPHKKTIYTLSYSPGYTFFGNDRTNQFNYSARADAHFLLNHLYLDVYATGIDQLRAHVSDFNRLATVRDRSTGVAGEFKYSSRTSALFNVNYRDAEYPPDRYQPRQTGSTAAIPVFLLDRTERNGRVSVMHKTFPLTSLFAAAEVSNYQFASATYKDSRRTYYGGGFAWSSGRTQLRAEAGPMKLDFEDPAQKDFQGLSARASLSRTSGPWSVGLLADRDLGFAITQANNYFISNSLSLVGSRQMGRRLTLRATATRQQDDFDQPVMVSGSAVDRRDRISLYSIGAQYGIRRVRFGADVGWFERDSTIFAEEDSGIRYVLHLSITP